MPSNLQRISPGFDEATIARILRLIDSGAIKERTLTDFARQAVLQTIDRIERGINQDMDALLADFIALLDDPAAANKIIEILTPKLEKKMDELILIRRKNSSANP